MTWIGRKKIAFIPVYRPNVPPPDPPDSIPADWKSDILRRVVFDPDSLTVADRSLRAYIRAASSGQADLDAVVMPMVVIDRKDIRLEHPDVQQLGAAMRAQGFDAAALVMLGLPGAGTSGSDFSKRQRTCVAVTSPLPPSFTAIMPLRAERRARKNIHSRSFRKPS